MFFALLVNPGIDLAAMDRSVEVRSPADLYRFANGGWLAKSSVQADRPYVGKVVDAQERNTMVLLRICARQMLANQPLNTAEGRVGLMFRLGMDQERANALGAKPLAGELARIAAIRDAKGLMRAIAHLGSVGVDAGFRTAVLADDQDSKRLLFTVMQPEPILKDRDLYLGTELRSKSARAQYLAAEESFLKLAGISKEGAAQALDLETALAQASSTPAELRDRAANYHKTTQAELRTLAPHVPWDAYFTELGVRPAWVNVTQPKALEAFDGLVASRPLGQWRSLLRIALLTGYSPYLSEDFAQGAFSITRILTGQQVALPRFARVLQATDETLGDALGQLYVREAFPPEAKAKARAMVENVLGTLRERIEEVDWMSPPTKREALAKLAAMTVKVGYPDRWKDYTDLVLKEDSFGENVMRAAAFDWKRQIAKLDRPVNRAEWRTNAFTLNAFYNPLWNEIVLPAGILQLDFFDAKADGAFNYGAIAAIIGHEVTHGFDDEGSRYDRTGLRRNWWAEEDRVRYDARGREIVAQYAAYKSPSGLGVNPTLTLSENIADIGGLAIAYRAYRKSLQGAEPPVLEGLTGDQRFFVAYAQNWRLKIRPEMERTLIATDTHAPHAVRANGPVADLPEFYRAFGLPVPANLPQVW